MTTIPTTGLTLSNLPSNPLVQQLFKKADTNSDGVVSANEFSSFMTNALSTSTGQAEFMALASRTPATPANLQKIAAQLGPGIGQIQPDGTTFLLNGGNGAIQIRDLGNGPTWQWMPATAATPAGK
jgi:hypothetical protein